MRLLPIQEVFSRKLERQRALPGLEFHASGHCVHIGPLSPGCYGCFAPPKFRHNVLVGARCNVDCNYCPGHRKDEEPTPDYWKRLKMRMWAESLADLGDEIPKLSFSGGGEPLLYLDVITDVMTWFRAEVLPQMRRRPWFYLYTNGLLADADALDRLRDLGFDEVRFHVGAAGFAPRVFEHIRLAAARIPTVTVETPSWPPHRDELLAMLPLLDELGVKHLNLQEVALGENNLDACRRALPEAEVYQCFDIHLYDGGLVYDLMEEVLRRGYRYSVLDCNSFVKSLQRSPGRSLMHDRDLEGLCAACDLSTSPRPTSRKGRRGG